MDITIRTVTNPKDITKSIKAKLKKRYNKLRNLEVKAGVLTDNSYPNGERVASVARQLEYGGVTEDGYFIPPRPFIRETVRKKSDEWKAQIKDSLSNGVTLKTTAERLGRRMADDIRETIREGDQFAPISPWTAMMRRARGNMDTTPLNDTGRLRESISNEVKSE